MFENNIETIKSTFLEFKGSGMYIALFLIAILYIYLKEENKQLKNFFVYYSLLIFVITLNPIFNKIVGGVFKGSVYWRMYWMLPLGVTIAYASVKLVSVAKDKIEKIVVLVSVITIIMVSGKFVYTSDNYKKLGNLYKLPDEDVLVAQLIGIDDEEYKKAMVPPDLTAHIRQIDANIELSYKRNPQTYENNPVVSALALGNVKDTVKIADERKCNYVVFERITPLDGKMEDYGFNILAETDKYVIYKR